MAVALIQRGRRILGIGDSEESALEFARDEVDWDMFDTVTVQDIIDEDTGYDGDLYFEDLYDPVERYAERHGYEAAYKFMMEFDEDKFYEERRKKNATKRVSEEEYISRGKYAENAIAAVCERCGISPDAFRGIRYHDVPEGFINEEYSGTRYLGVYLHVPREVVEAAGSGMALADLVAMWSEFAPIADVKYPPAECWSECSVRRAPEAGGA